MENEAGKTVWMIGARMMALAIGLLTIALIVWVASKAWKKGQVESNYADGSFGNESNYAGKNWLGY
jgi:hypothetical protein